MTKADAFAGSCQQGWSALGASALKHSSCQRSRTAPEMRSEFLPYPKDSLRIDMEIKFPKKDGMQVDFDAVAGCIDAATRAFFGAGRSYVADTWAMP